VSAGRRGLTRILLRTSLCLVLAAGAWAAPASAGTKQDLDAAKARLAAAQSSLDAATARWQSAEQRLFELRVSLSDTRVRVAQLQEELARDQARLEAHARAAFMLGAEGGAISTVLEATSFSDLADRVEYASSVVNGDEDLAIAVRVRSEELQRVRTRLAETSAAQADAVSDLHRDQMDVQAEVTALNAEVDRLDRQLTREQQQQIGLPAGPPSVGTGAIQTCPVRGPTSFVDSFGWPRPGGRVHEGIDMLAAEGTPVVAVHAGSATRNPNDLGGNAVVLHHDGSADWTYYAHLSAYGATGHVAVGTVIGYVGHTGDTTTNHLHFEYHPGGGDAVDPYRALLAVC
jgi:peptidoglycan LD-endopeptidase LytH